jgi:CRP/FNR family transcriptional regulator, polysaccharide utilization system transcription regulator
MHTDCDQCASRDKSVFCDLHSTGLHEITARKRCRTYSRGEIIFYAGDRPLDLFCVQKGMVKIYRVGSDGREQIVRLAAPGDVVGYRSLIGGESYAAFAAAIEDVEICHIPRDLFLSLLAEQPALAANIMALLAGELRIAEERIVDMAQKPVRERLAETLLLMKSSYGVDADGTTLSIRLTRIELSSFIGTAPETVSRALAVMKEEGIIEMEGRRIMITDHDALVEAANVED